MKSRILNIVIGIVILGFGISIGYNSASFKGKNAQEWEQLSQRKDTEIASMSAQLQDDKSTLDMQSFLLQVTPTPQIVYKTQYITDPSAEDQLVQTQQKLKNLQDEQNQPVRYNYYGGDTLYGNDGSRCNTYGSNTLYCNK